MRKEVTLGMAIGGALLVVGVVSVSLSHKNNNKKTNGQVTLLQPTDTSGAGESAQPNDESKDTKSDVKSEDSKQTKAPDAKTQATGNTSDKAQANADPKKNDAIDRLLFGGGQTPLISRTPDPKAENTETKTTTTDAADHTTPTPGPTVAEQTKPTEAVQLPASPSTQPAGARKHTVQKGETFSTIAAAAYGSANYYPHIMRANPNVEANRLKPGMVINLPAVSDVVPSEKAEVRTEAVPVAHKTVVAATIDPTKEYKVVSGDSLHKIATNLYGKVGMVDKIYELNKSTIGPNPAALKIGMVLKLPEPPVSVAANANAR